MGNHIVVITLSLSPEFFYKQLIDRPVKSGKIIFPTLGCHLYPQIHVVFSKVAKINPQFLQYLKELSVDFSNLAKNDMDLRIEMTAQGWENYFARLHGPVY